MQCPIVQRRFGYRWLRRLAAVLACLVGGQSFAEEAVDFSRDVRPILAQRCYRCHGPNEAKGGLRLDEQSAAVAELDSGQRAIVVGAPEQSALLARVAAEDDELRMPPEGKPLSPQQIETLRRWIAQGATWKNHWAFEPLSNVVPPRVQNQGWVRNPIDAFIAERLEAAGLTPAAPASPRALLRRVYFDLTGLPPTPEECDAFLADPSDAAYERVVDGLLASPRYGERWGRHWLDLVRYADTNSFERDAVKPNAWRYRDYVIRSLNADKPYTQFIREQLAGDELSDVTHETLIATGYYRLGLWDDEPADPLLARFDELDDIVSTTGQVFLGLTVNCARCHDHKLDPISQADYYRMLSFFHEVQRYHPQACQTDISPPELKARYQQLDQEKEVVQQQMLPIEQQGISKMPAEDQRRTEGRERKKLLEEKLRSYLDDGQWEEYSRLKAKLEAIEATKLPPRDTVLSVGPCLAEVPQTFVLARGNPHVEGERVEPAFLTVLGGGTPPVVKTDHSSGRRLALANWIASESNPLSARVMVNRLWQHHFGRGLVRASSNFGSLSPPPTHPELLDWLSRQFISGSWRLKSLHRLIVTSSAYRMSNAANEQALAADPQNDLFWRFDMRRLGAEELRDSILATSGRLNLDMYGPGVFPKLSPEVLASQSIPGNGWGKSAEDQQRRRSIYIHVKRSLAVPILAEFDACDTDGSCAVRFSTTQPTQALGMINGDFVREEAAAMAARLRREVPGDVSGQARRGLRLALGAADPTAESRGLKLIETLRTRHGVSAERALDYFCLMVLNLNEFIYLE